MKKKIYKRDGAKFIAMSQWKYEKMTLEECPQVVCCLHCFKTSKLRGIFYFLFTFFRKGHIFDIVFVRMLMLSYVKCPRGYPLW